MDGKTYIDDLETLLKKLVGFLREMVSDAIFRGSIRLVNMYSACWAALLATNVANIRGSAANSMIEDENARCSGAVTWSVYFCCLVVRWLLRILQQLFNLWVVVCLDNLVVQEILFLAFMPHILEAMTVDAILILFT
jgi:hypothetical protein